MKKHIILLLVASLGLASCGKEYLETTPSESISEQLMFTDLTGAQTVLEGLHRATYQYYKAHDRFGQKSIDLVMDIMGEDFYQTAAAYGWYNNNYYRWVSHRNATDGRLEYVWAYYYDLINGANIILKNIDNITIYDAEIPKKNWIKAQALFYRAHSYYMLVQLFSTRYDYTSSNNTQLGVPIYTEPTSTGKERSTVQAVYTQIKTDLQDAVTLLTGNTTAQPDISHPNLNTVYGLYARVALTTGDWTNAATYAANARTGKTIVSGANLIDYGWNKSNSEWLWGAYLIDEQQTSYASFFSHIDPYFGGYAGLGGFKNISTLLYDHMSATDYRKEAWFISVNASNPRVGQKFSGWGEWTNDYLYMRAGEMYIIEAEAKARIAGQEAAAKQVLTTYMLTRDPNYDISSLTGTAVLNEILLQRRIELWGEGQRFLDLKRLNLPLDRANLGHNSTNWGTAGYYAAGAKEFTWLIPQSELDANSSMVQNPL